MPEFVYPTIVLSEWEYNNWYVFASRLLGFAGKILSILYMVMDLGKGVDRCLFLIPFFGMFINNQ